MSLKMAFTVRKFQMLITFLLVGGFEKFKVLQKAYFEYIKKYSTKLGSGVEKGSVGLA